MENSLAIIIEKLNEITTRLARIENALGIDTTASEEKKKIKKLRPKQRIQIDESDLELKILKSVFKVDIH